MFVFIHHVLHTFYLNLSISFSYVPAQSAVAIEFTDCILQRGKIPRPNKCPGYDTEQSDGEASVILELLGNVEYFFIPIAPRSTLAQSGSTWLILSMAKIEQFDI